MHADPTTPRRPGRPPRVTPEPPADIPTPGLPALVEASNQVAAADAVIMDAYEVLIQTGRIEGLEFLKRVSDVAIAQTFTRIKEASKYKGLPYKDEQGNLKRVSDLEEYCQVFLGKTYRRCFDLAQNLHLLGPELYEQTERIGFRAKDYAALKALPADDQAIVTQALEAESKDTVLDLLQELAARAQREKDAAARREADLKADLEARENVLKSTRARKEALEDELARRDAITPDQAEVERQQRYQSLLDELQLAATALIGQAAQFAITIKSALNERQQPQEADAITKTVQLVFTSIADIARRNDIPVDFQHVVNPPWQGDQQG